MNEIITSMKLLYETSGNSQSIADAFGVTEQDFKGVLQRLINNTPNFGSLNPNDKMQKLIFALQNFKAINGNPDIKIEDIARFANASLKAFKGRLPSLLMKIFKDELNIELDKSSENAFKQINIEFNKSIIKTDKNAKLGDIVENFITVKDMKILYESSQNLYYKLTLDDIFRTIDTTTINLDDVSLEKNLLRKILDKYKDDKARSQADKMLYDAIGTDILYQDSRFDSNNAEQYISGYIKELIEDNLALAVVTAISHNTEVFNKNGIEVVSGISQSFIRQKKIFDFSDAGELPWADAIVRQLGNDPAKLQSVFDSYIDEATVKYFMLDSREDSLYKSIANSRIELMNKKLAGKEKKRKDLLSEFDNTSKEAARNAKRKFEFAIKEASRVKQTSLKKLSLLRQRDQQVDEDNAIRTDNFKKFIQKAGVYSGGAYGVLGAYSALSTAAAPFFAGKVFLTTAAAEAGVGTTLTAALSSVGGAALGAPLAIATPLFVGWAVSKAISHYSGNRPNTLRRLLGYQKDNLSYGQNKDITDEDFGKTSSKNMPDDKNKSFNRQARYLEIEDEIEKNYNEAVNTAKVNNDNAISRLEGDYAASLKDITQLDVDIAGIKHKYANSYEDNKNYLMTTDEFKAVRRSIASVVLAASKVGQKAIKVESMQSLANRLLLLEAEEQQINADFIDSQLLASGISDISEELRQVSSFVLKELFDIKVDGVQAIDLDKEAQQQTIELKEEEVKKIPAGQPAIEEIESINRVVSPNEQVEVENVLPVLNNMGGENMTNFMKELCSNPELQQVIARIIDGEKLTYSELMNEIEESSNELSGLDKALVEGIDTFKANLPPITIEFAKQIIKDKIGRNQEKIIALAQDLEGKPEKLDYKSLYDNSDLKPRVTLLSQYFKITRDEKHDPELTHYVLPQISYFVSSILKDAEKEDKINNLDWRFLDKISFKIYTKGYNLNESVTINKKIIKDNYLRRLQLETDIHNVLLKTWKY